MHSPKPIDHSAARIALGHRRAGGAVIIIVLTLLSTLVFLGFFFFGFTDQAQKTAQAYAEAEDYEIDAEEIIARAHEQLLVGVRPGFEESALWGNKHSILPHIVGPIDTSLRPKKDALYSGTGVALVVYDPDPSDDVYYLSVDYDGDGVGDDLLDGDGAPDIAFTVDTSTSPPTYTAGYAFRLNYSRVAQGTEIMNDAFWALPNSPLPAAGAPVPDYDPAAGYTYPDLNSLFLAHDSFTTISNGTNSVNARVVIPSFFRPQLMLHCRDAVGTGPGPGGFADVFRAEETTNASLRPHLFHANYNNERRFISTTTRVAESGNTNRILRPFPFRVDLNVDGVANEMGVFSRANPGTAGGVSQLYEYDFDADNDGVRDAIWMDLGLQMIDLPDGRQVVPLVAFKVLDSDGLFNLNVHGNMAGGYVTDLQQEDLLVDLNGDGMLGAGDLTYPLHRSNQGLSPTEVNMALGLTGDPTVLSAGAARKLLEEFTASRISSTTLAAEPRRVISNAELLFLLTGRFQTATGAAIPGRHGEPDLLVEHYGDPANARRPRAGLTQSSTVTAIEADNDHDAPSVGGIGYVAANGPSKPFNTPPAVHPLAFTGTGAEYIEYSAATTPHGGIRRHPATAPYAPENNPSNWPTYESSVSGHWTDQGMFFPGTAVHGVLPYKYAGPTGAGLQTSYTSGDPNDLVDEDDEVTANANFPDPADARFQPSEIPRLQLSEADYRLLRESSRLEELAPFNFRDSPDAPAIRKLFSTESWARTEFSRPSPGSIRNFEFNRWTGDPDFPMPNDLPRFNGFEFYDDDSGTPGRFDLHFPPQFGPSAGGGGPAEVCADTSSNIDPYRRELRQLLWTRLRGAAWTTDASGRPNYKSTRDRPQHRLSLNGILAGFDSQTNPIYRPLVPHPAFDESDRDAVTQAPYPQPFLFPAMYHGQHEIGEGDPPNASTTVPTPPGSVPAYSTVNDTSLSGRLAMEWWARYDRQRMARDIYVLLWTLSGGNDAQDYMKTVADTTTDVPATTGFEADTFDATTPQGRKRVREMAQFAVNLVDAMDSDSVITRFEYDTNLTNGWQASGELDVVYGVESQQLAFSEVMHFLQPTRDDLTGTYHDESQYPGITGTVADRNDLAHQFLYIELRNTTPFTVEFNDRAWRIARVRRDMSVGPADANVDASVEFRVPAMGTPKSVAPGGNFVIACHDGKLVNPGGNPVPADFYGQTNTDADFESIVPRSATPLTAGAMTVPVPLVDLDLTSADSNHQPYVNVTKPYVSPLSTTAMPVPVPVDRYDGSALVGRERIEGPTPHPDAAIEYDLVLMRRRNLNSYGIGETYGASEELWIEVDRFQVRETRELEITGNAAADIEAGFRDSAATPAQPVASFERRQPFDARRVRNTDTGAQMHSIVSYTDAANRHAKNFVAIQPSEPTRTTYTLWQPHFDRPFSSVMELLSIPLYGYVGNSTEANDATARVIDYDHFYFGGPTHNLAGVLNGGVNEDAQMIGHRTAAIRMLYPGPDLPGGAAMAYTGLANLQPDDFVHYRNRWYRLLEFLEVPDQADRTIEGRATWKQRTPGKINLNTVRNEQVLAGLLDDPLAQFDHSNVNALTNDRIDGANRNWFQELLRARDGFDPILAASSVVGNIPGTMDSRPFRPFSYVAPPAANPDTSSEHTLLRSRAFLNTSTRQSDLVANGLDIKHGLFEARTLTDLSTSGAGDENRVDFHTKNRLLAKVHNRTTNRSHVYFVWTGIGFFEAHRASGTQAGYVQIGAQAEDIPVRRSFMVCDMSRIEDAYDDPDPTDDIPGSFDFRKFIIYHKLIK